MLSIIMKNWDKYSTGYEWKSVIDLRTEKNMDIYSGAVAVEKYLPRYSAREPEKDYNDRLKRAENGFMNFPQKIIDIYRNSVFRSGPPNREGKSDEAKRFIENVDGSGTHIGDFVRDRIFILEQVHGGLFLVVDKPKKPDADTFTKRDQQRQQFFPYVYIYEWRDMVNFGVDRHKGLDWVLFKESFMDSGEKKDRYRYFDKNVWAVLDEDGKILNNQTGEHGLGVVPVHWHFQRRNPAHRFLTPSTALDDVFRLTLKLFESQSQLEQMIINHVFMKIAMPEGMFKMLQAEGGGNKNAFVYPNGQGDDKAYYIQSEFQEIEQMKDLVFTKYPDKILYFATLRDKVAMPREESGQAKFIDSSDEISNLLDKARSMEKAENAIINIAKRWENDSGEFRVTYNKVFDIQSTNQQIEEIVKVFKQDLGSAAFNKALVKRLMMNMLGEVPADVKADIEKDLDYTTDPSLNIDDIDKLAQKGLLDAVKLARKYNPELRGEKVTDEQVKEWIQGNINTLFGVNSFESDEV